MPATHLPSSGLLGRQSECEALDRLVAGVRGGPEPRAGPARRGGRRQDRAAGAPGGERLGVPGRPRGGRRVRDGAPVRRPARAVRADARPPAAPSGPAARRAEHGVRARRGPAAGPVHGRAGGAEPARRRRRGAAADVHRRRRAVARSRVGADAGVRRAPAAGGAGRAGVRRARGRRRSRRSAGCRSWRSRASARSTRARCWTRRFPGRSTSACATGSSPRRAAIRSRCWSCRAG